MILLLNMKIIHQDLRKGKIKIRIENLDDLWYLSSVIDEGDFVKGKSLRKISKSGKEERSKDVRKKTVFLKIRVGKIEFSKTSNILKVLGKVEEGPEDVPKGSHHSFNLEEGSVVSVIKKEWLKYQLDKIKEASSEKVAKILICVFDREEAYFALMKKYGYEMLMHLEGDVQKKADVEVKKGSFYQQIIKQILEYDKRYGFGQIILGSPSFWKQELYKELKDDQLKKKMIQATCSSVDKNGVDEVLKRDEVRKALAQDRITREINLVESLLVEISKENLGVYGIKEVSEAIVAGAVKDLLITDKFILKERGAGRYGRVDGLMKQVEKMGGKIHIISSGHDGGKKLDGLSGIGGILRYKMRY